MKKQILKTMIPTIKYSTLSKKIIKINVSKQKKEEEKNWNKFFQNISSLYIKKINF